MEAPNSRPKAPEHRYHIGMRIVKTVVAVFLCGVFAYIRNESALFSMFAALFCIQNSTEKTIQSSVNRMVGTLIGGVVGIFVVHGMNGLSLLHVDLLRYLVLSLLLIPIIKFSLWINKKDAAGMACMVLMCLVVDPGTKPIIDSVERVFETLVGAALACGIDMLLPHHYTPQPAGEGADSPADPAGAEAGPPADSGEDDQP